MNDINFDWINFYGNLLEKICQLSDDNDEASRKLFEIYQKLPGQNYNFDDFNRVDPLTFIALISRNLHKYTEILKKIFHISNFPEGRSGIPSYNSQKLDYVYAKEIFFDKSKSNDTDNEVFNNLWEFAREVNSLTVREVTFEKLLNYADINTPKLSKFMFICKPSIYYSIDERMRGYVGVDKYRNFADFQNFQNICKEKFPKEEPYKISDKAYQQFVENNRKAEEENPYKFQINKMKTLDFTLIAMSDDKEKIYTSRTVSETEFFEEMKKFKQKRLMPLSCLKKNPQFFEEIEHDKFKLTTEGYKQAIKMRNKLEDAKKKLEQKCQKSEEEKVSDMNINSKNIILYGPPGTGKTYNTILKAMSIIDGYDYNNENYIVEDESFTINPEDKNYNVIRGIYGNKIKDNKIPYDALKERFKVLKRKGQIEFITFHQSYSYEEFVEGIKPATEGDRQFENKDGIFKKIAKEALFAQLVTNNLIDNSSSFYKIIDKFKEEYPIGSVLETQEKNEFEIVKYTEDSIRIEPIIGARRTLSISYKPLAEMYLINKENKIAKRRDLEEAMNNRYKGLSSYYLPILKIIEELSVDDENIEYGKKFKEKTIKEFYQNKISINKVNNVPYVLIVDEINRGNISKIFGELITLIEDDKRLGNEHELTTKLPYSQEDFGIPSNLYIIGTMNTADKSLALLDVALRRRFEFVAKYPSIKILEDNGYEKGAKVLKVINENLLNAPTICNKNNKYDYLIGHAYFMCDDEIKNILEKKVIPLLMEYFNGDVDKVAGIINGKIEKDGKSEVTGFIAEFNNAEHPYEWVVNEKV